MGFSWGFMVSHTVRPTMATQRTELWLTQGKTLSSGFGLDPAGIKILGKSGEVLTRYHQTLSQRLGKGIHEVIYGAIVPKKAHCNGIEEPLGTPDVTSNCKYIAIFVSLI